MITKLSHATIYVLNQDEALKFYTEKLGFEVRTDVAMGEFRWLTVGPKGQPDMEIILYAARGHGGMMDEETIGHLRAILEKGLMGVGVFVEFLSPPEERPYGIEATFKDNSGNWFSLTQHR